MIEGTIGERLGEVVRRHGSRAAILTRRQALTFEAWAGQVNRLAHAILATSRDANEPVAVTGSAASTLTGLFACLVAGRTAVPLHPSASPERLTLLLEDSGARLIVGDGATLAELMAAGRTTLDVDRLDPGLAVTNPGAQAEPETPAYILYTSGSTGAPKGVAFTHRTVLAMARIHSDANAFTHEDRSLLLGTATSSQAMAVVFPALLAGGAVCPFDLDADGAGALASFLGEQAVTVYHSVPALFRTLLTLIPRGEGLGALRLVKLGGDTVLRSDLELFAERFPRGVTLRVGFASTEAGPVAAVRFTGEEAARVSEPLPVGRPYPGVSVSILGEDGQQLPTGEPGEIAVRSPALASGYWRRPELTRERFLEGRDGLPRTFLTGDLGRLSPDGMLFHLGRRDLQVKVRGVRVEIGEVEAALRTVPGVREGAVVAVEEPSGEKRLVAHVVPAVEPTPAPAPTPASLRRALRSRLAEPMVPGAFVLRDALPRNARGKVDRELLAGAGGAAGTGASPTGREAIGPRDELERQMTAIWQDVLGVPVADVGADFFDLGGTSLLAVNLFLEIARRTGRTLPLATLVEAPSVEELCQVLRRPASWSPLVALQPAGSGLPFFCVHGMGGQVLVFRDLARRLGDEQPFYGLQRERDEMGGSRHHSVPVMADQYLEAVRGVQPRGPYRIGGFSLGAVIAFEMAQRLRAAGEEVSLLALLEPPEPPGRGAPPESRGVPYERDRLDAWGRLWRSARFQASALSLLEPAERPSYVVSRSRRLLLRLSGRLKVDPEQEVERLPGSIHRADPYTRLPYPGKVTLFRAQLGGASPRDWERLAEGGLEVHDIPGAHSFIVKEPFVRALARELRACLSRQPDAGGSR